MNKQSVNQESNEPKLFELSPYLAGAFTGVLAALLLSLLYRSIGLISLAVGFLFPGYLLLEKIDSLNFHIPTLITFLISYGVSSIPPTIIGALIFSNRSILRFSGVLSLLIYAILWMFFSFFFHIMAD